MMKIFNNLKVGTKIFVGFFMLLILMVVIGGVAFFQFTRINATVTDLADNLAKDQHLADKMVSQILLARFYANKYIQAHKLEDLNRFKQEFAHFEKLLADADREITQKKRILMLVNIKSGVQDYSKHFAQVAEFMDKRHKILTEVLDVQGPLAEQKLEQLRDSAFQAEDAITSFYAGNAQRIFLLMRLDAFKYLEEGEPIWVKKFKGRYQEAQTAFNQLDEKLQDSSHRLLAQEAQTTIDQYYQGFMGLQMDYAQQNQIIETQLNQIGPQIRKTSLKMSDSVTIDFDTTNQVTRALVTHTQIQLLITMAIALLVGIGLIFVISRSITAPLTKVIETSQQMVVGNMSQIVDVQNRAQMSQIISRRDEMGDIGRAYDALANYFRTLIEDIVQVSQELAKGNLNVIFQSEYRGDFIQIKNALEIALSNQQQVIEDIVQVSQGIASGNWIRPQVEYQGDFVQIKNALEMALSNQQQVIEDIVQVSQGLAEGNLQVRPQVKYQGDFVQIKEALETALTDLRQVITDIVQVSQGLAGGQSITFQAKYRGDFEQTQKALEIAALRLAETMDKNATQDWLKTGQNQLNDQMSGDQNIVELTHNIVSFLTLYLETQVGVCYLVEGTLEHKHSMKLIASYAQTRRKNLAEEFQFSDGLVERAAKELNCISIHIETGLEAETVPPHVIVMPFLYENVIKGVIVLGSLERLADIQQEFLHQVMPSIGIAVNSVESRTKMQELLLQTQAQSEELQNQQEELQQTNEELQSQSEELQSQTEELQSQQEELQQTNEALEERTNALESQKAEIQHKNLALEKNRAEMEQAQIAIKRKAEELELASRYKSEFLANMSHELRTPLNSLLILAQLLADNKPGNLTDKQIEYAQTIHSAGSDLLTLINEILDLSKVEAGKIEVQLEDVPLADLITKLDQKFRHVAEEKQLAFPISLADDLPPVINTDGQRLQQILNNLLSNAFKFTGQGEVRLEIERPKSPLTPLCQSGELQSSAADSPLSQRGARGDFPIIAFRVTDTGIGIPKDKQGLIFEAFQQVDGTTSRRFGGTGLGLSISRQLAQLLGGELHLHSEEGKGSTFTLYLPEQFEQKNSNRLGPYSESSILSQTQKDKNEVLMASTDTSKVSQNESLQKSETLPPISDDRIHLNSEDKILLIIEDDRKFSRLLMDLAQEKAFKCLVAEDGQTGLQLATEYKPHAIILDVGLPLLDGWMVMNQLKDNPDTRHIPVHFISGTDQSLEAKKMGAIGYLHKPVSLEQLGNTFKKIEQFLTRTVKNLLIVVDSEPRQQKILELVGGENIQIRFAMTKSEAFQRLETITFDCIILDMDIEQGSGIQLLEQMQQEKELCQVPVIIYAERDLTSSEETILLQCAEHIPVKSVKSQERLLDEATLFLHQLETKLPHEKRNMLRMVHDKQAILKNKTVLIVDDDVRNIFALATVLEDHEMEVICTKNGKEGLEALEEHDDIALILMDIMMPEMDGYEAMREIRKQPRFRQLPIIALTAKAMKGDKAKCIEAGANDYLSKPVDMDKLISLMRVWLYR